MKEWPKILKLGSVYVGILKLINLVSKVTAYTRYVSGNIIIIIRGAYNRIIGRETQQAQDQVRVQQVDLAVRQAEEVQGSDVQISHVSAGVTAESLSESQDSSDAVEYGTAGLHTRHFEDGQTSSDALTYESAELVPSLSYDELQDSSDASLYDIAVLVSLSFDEEQMSLDALDSSEAERKMYLLRDRQYSNEIPVAYIPVGDETLEVHALTETQQAIDSIEVSKSSLVSFEETQTSADSVYVQTVQITYVSQGVAEEVSIWLMPGTIETYVSQGVAEEVSIWLMPAEVIRYINSQVDKKVADVSISA